MSNHKQTQVVPISFQTSIPHRPGKWGARFSGQWVATSMFVLKLLPRGHQRSNWRKPRIKEISTWFNICRTNPIKVLKLHGIFWRFRLCPSNDIYGINEKLSMLALGPHRKDRTYSRDEANIGDLKLNRGGFLPFTVYGTSADYVEITHRPSEHHIPLGVYHIGGFNVMLSWARGYVSILGLKLIHVTKRGPT